VVLCICQAVTDREIDAAIHAGARSLADIEDRCGGAGSDCGCCREAIEARLSTSERRPCGAGCKDCPRAVASAA
jgi:bacterioferritin-associated ferredoxin